MRTSYSRLAFCAWAVSGLAAGAQIPGLYSASYQVNVDAAGHNIVGDAANEPTLCIDPTNPNRMAIGWRQFDSVTNDFRQAGWAWSTNGGLSWTFPGVVDPGVFRSDPVLAADAEGTFYYLGVLTNSNYHCDLFRSTNGGMNWQSLGQALGGDKPWLASDTTTGPGRGNLYQAWSAPRRLNDDSPTANAYHWFGTLSVAPNGRIDACWNDTRSDPSQTHSQLYYAYSQDAGLTWSTNCALTSPFNHTLGYPMQEKMGDYLGMVSLDAAACIAYAATFNGEEDVYFACVELPLTLHLALAGNTVQLSWNSAPARTYCLQAKDSLLTPWSAATNLGCLTGTGGTLTMQDSFQAGAPQRFYRVVGPR